MPDVSLSLVSLTVTTVEQISPSKYPMTSPRLTLLPCHLYYNPLLPDFSIYNINIILLYPIFKCFIAPVPTFPASSCPLPILSYLNFSPNKISMFSESALLCMCALRLCVMALRVLLLHPSLALPFPLKNS